ncbi:hypothetical protein J41TS12_38200 [Paenibacillus antibioticophila]|uniref:Uncharacterized protein n=1 Tax=Paenibacillus antibioticophila TaxID=1274374 RepID=A0A919XTZ6_9BACL|nr:hypothetical protein J41TS12_38200 [Paenibacillus antibioticophila]
MAHVVFFSVIRAEIGAHQQSKPVEEIEIFVQKNKTSARRLLDRTTTPVLHKIIQKFEWKSIIIPLNENLNH